MSVVFAKEPGALRVNLSGKITVADARAIHERLAAELDAETSLVVDAGEVTRIDASIAQVFLVAEHRARAVRVVACSEPWTAAWALLGHDVANDRFDGRLE